MTTNSVNINSNGLVVFDSTTGQFSAAELTTKGDLLTRNSSAYIRRAVGTNGQALLADSAQATGLNWGAIEAGSSTIFLESQTASTSATIDFTSFDDATYVYYLMTYVNVRPATDAVDLRFRVSVDGGSSYLTSNYQWARIRYSSSTGSSSQNENTSDTRIELAGAIGSDTREGVSGKLLFFPSPNPGSTRPSPFLYDNVFYRSDGIMYRNFGAGSNSTSSTINAVRFLFSSGNISTGIFKLYGIKNTL